VVYLKNQLSKKKVLIQEIYQIHKRKFKESTKKNFLNHSYYLDNINNSKIIKD
jgi:hypothetical protein